MQTNEQVLRDAIHLLSEALKNIPYLDTRKVSKDMMKAYKTFPEQQKSLEMALDVLEKAQPGEAYAQAVRLFQVEIDLAREIVGVSDGV